jgi:hypothetical protein
MSMYPQYFECTLCGRSFKLSEPWTGRPQGPQCPCNPNTWGNWRRLTGAEVRTLQEDAHLQESERWFKEAVYYDNSAGKKYEAQRLGFVYLLRWAMVRDGANVEEAHDACAPTNGVPVST